MAKTVLLAAALGLLLAAAVAAAVFLWTQIPGGGSSVHMWVALIAGAGVSLALGAGLMWLVFYSSRRGYDDAVESRDD